LRVEKYLEIPESRLWILLLCEFSLWTVGKKLTFSPMARMIKPEKGITQPWVIPHALCTTTKSAKNNKKGIHFAEEEGHLL
jgi:hypothetical protein